MTEPKITATFAAPGAAPTVTTSHCHADLWFRRGMTTPEREEFRRVVAAKGQAQADAYIRTAFRSFPCAQTQHAVCRAEGPGGAGCLCECHDDTTEAPAATDA